MIDGHHRAAYDVRLHDTIDVFPQPWGELKIRIAERAAAVKDSVAWYRETPGAGAKPWCHGRRRPARGAARAPSPTGGRELHYAQLMAEMRWRRDVEQPRAVVGEGADRRPKERYV